VYTSDDLVGVELGGSLKNIIAIAAGISDGLGFGTNTKAAILTRGLAEISRLGVAMGARRETFSGLSGIGDLITTCISPYSRNRWFGEMLGKGKKAKEISEETEMVVEGVTTSKSAYELSNKYNVDMPITREIYNIIYNDKSSKDAVNELMLRSAKPEHY
jgi:glycerol-3-phosphate dehydrogenase (NAD(P)+)